MIVKIKEGGNVIAEVTFNDEVRFYVDRVVFSGPGLQAMHKWLGEREILFLKGPQVGDSPCPATIRYADLNAFRRQLVVVSGHYILQLSGASEQIQVDGYMVFETFPQWLANNARDLLIDLYSTQPSEGLRVVTAPVQEGEYGGRNLWRTTFLQGDFQGDDKIIEWIGCDN